MHPSPVYSHVHGGAPWAGRGKGGVGVLPTRTPPSPFPPRTGRSPCPSTRHVRAAPQAHGVLEGHGPLPGAPCALEVEGRAVPVVHGGRLLDVQSNQGGQRGSHSRHDTPRGQETPAHGAHGPVRWRWTRSGCASEPGRRPDTCVPTMADVQEAARLLQHMARARVVGDTPPAREAARREGRRREGGHPRATHAQPTPGGRGALAHFLPPLQAACRLGRRL